jgi:hypothetical protein
MIAQVIFPMPATQLNFFFSGIDFSFLKRILTEETLVTFRPAIIFLVNDF